MGDVDEITAMQVAGMNAYQGKADASEALLHTLRRLLRASDRSIDTAPAANRLADQTKQQPTNPDCLSVPIDLAHVATQLGLPPADISTCFQLFQQDHRHSPSELQQTLSTNDRHSLQQQAHKIQGSAALLGMQSLQQAALALQQADTEISVVELDAKVKHLIKQLQIMLKQTMEFEV